MRVFILGAGDPEMHAIEALLKEHGECVVYASCQNRRVSVHNAYAATGVMPQMPANATEIIFVECLVMGLRYMDLIDHHRPGDPGYDMAPEQYLEGSSFGQLLSMLGVEPTDEQRIICAADHCLTHAYQGRCPGVDRALTRRHWQPGVPRLAQPGPMSLSRRLSSGFRMPISSCWRRSVLMWLARRLPGLGK